SRWCGSGSTPLLSNPEGAKCAAARSCSPTRNSARTSRRPSPIGSSYAPGVLGFGRSPWLFFEKRRRQRAMKWLFMSLAAAFAVYGQKIETEKPDRTRITRVETAMNHLTVIEVGDPVEQVAAGSASYKVEWRGNKVFVQPLEPDAQTNLFIWTRSGARLNYELAPAGAVEKMLFAIHQGPAATAAAAPPGPGCPAGVEKP